jgi:hypothetical protein
MTSITIQITDQVALDLQFEARARHLSVEQIAAERIAAQSLSENRKPTPAQGPVIRDDLDSVIGSFVDRPDLLESLETVIEDRARKYAL